MTWFVCTSTLVAGSPSRLVKKKTYRDNEKVAMCALTHRPTDKIHGADQTPPLPSRLAISVGKKNSLTGVNVRPCRRRNSTPPSLRPAPLPQGGQVGGVWMKRRRPRGQKEAFSSREGGFNN